MSLSHSAAIAGLLNSATNVAEDLETMGAIMIMIGNHVPDEDIHGEWITWFGRQVEIACETLEKALKEVP
jgi:hypothetical protein